MSSTISPQLSPNFAMERSQSDAILEHHLDDVVELAEPQESLSAPSQHQFLSADYAPVRIAEQVSVDNQNEALEVLTSHQTSVIMSKTPPFDCVHSVEPADIEENVGDQNDPGQNNKLRSDRERMCLEESAVPKESKQDMNLMERLRQKLNIGNELYRAALAEFFCTGFLLFGGCSVTAQFVLSQRRTNEWVCVVVGWGIVLLIAVQMSFRISGAHLNPAVSFFLFTQKKINAIRFFVFVIAQNIGAFLGAFTTFIVYYDAINSFDNGTRYVSGPRSTAHIFATYPQPHLSTIGGIIDQVLGTAVLCLGVAAITDRRNRIPPFLQPSFIGVLLIGIGMMLALNAGYAINPARDFGPRLFTLCAGYGWRVFSYRSYKWFWIPIIGPMIGGLIGAWIYEFFIGFHIPDDPDTSYIHKIIDDRNPEGQLREIHVVEKKPISEVPAAEASRSPTHYRNM